MKLTPRRVATLLMLGWIQVTMLRKHLSGNHLVVLLTFGSSSGSGSGTHPLVELDRGRTLLWAVGRAALGRDRTLAWLTLTRDDGGVWRQDKCGQGPFRFFYFGGQASGCAALGADTFLVLFPEPADENEGPNANDGGARNDGRDDWGLCTVA
jgi:hypothetical protein